VPVDDAEGVPIDTILAWKKSVYAKKHDVYFGTDFNDVNDANRTNTLGVLVSQNHSTTTYDPAGFLDLNKTYYWRIDEVNDPNIWKGEVWSFRTLPYSGVVEDFDSYANNTALRNVWQKNGTSAEVSVETTIARDGNSMRYQYKNNLPPYYSQTYADITDLGMDNPDWLGIGAKTLVLYFYGEPNNPLSEQMYVKLTDGDSPAKTATVMYGNINDVRLKQWNKWSIALTKFADVNLANVASITIGFGDGSAGNAGTVYFEDITLDSTAAEVLPEVTGEVNVSTVYQELEGFGAAVGWSETLPSTVPQPQRNELYDALFSNLGLDIYRIRNTYGYISSYIDTSAQIIAAGKARNPSLKILLSSWTPQTSLKSNNHIEGGGNATLIKEPADPNNSAPYYYAYKKYAKWWADSLNDWSNHGVVADYVSMQNEPDFDTATWASCRFEPNENASIAGYRQAFEAVYQELYSRMGTNMPKLLVPETAGLNYINDYIDNLIDANHAYGYAHHLYNGGGAYNNADGYISAMTNFRDSYYGDKPLMQTEFSKGTGDMDVTTFPEAMNLAQLMHNTLVFENASAYLYWELFEWRPKGLVSFTWGGNYTINPIYYAFKQYSAFTDPGWHRVEASTNLGDVGNLRISAFKSPDNQQLSIVIINLAYNSINLTLSLNGFLPGSSEIYRTSETENTVYIGPFYEAGSLMLPARSITTIHSNSTVFSNCDDVLNAGYRLTSDIYPDCYVNYKDLKIIADHWLNTNCTEPGNCGGADFEPTDGIVDLFDFSDFAMQWLWCNNPTDPNCTPNWP
jgi:glucuronoarabinoxylan endo-1,4-beta-xylanase